MPTSKLYHHYIDYFQTKPLERTHADSRDQRPIRHHHFKTLGDILLTAFYLKVRSKLSEKGIIPGLR